MVHTIIYSNTDNARALKHSGVMSADVSNQCLLEDASVYDLPGIIVTSTTNEVVY